MPKQQSKSAWLREWIKRIGANNVYSTDGKVIFCDPCQKQVLKTTVSNNKLAPNLKVACEKYFQLQQHNDSAKHKANAEKFFRASGSKQQFLTQPTKSKGPDPDKFSMDLCEAMLSADIPFRKLDNKKLRKFLEVYCNKIVPDQSTIRKNYLPKSYEKCMQKIRDELSNEFCWISVDETVDKSGRSMANLLIGKLDTEKWHPPALISAKELEKVDSGSVARFVNDGIDNLFTNGVQKEKILLLVTDGVAYMKKAGRQLKTFYVNLLHVTCLAHGLHRVAEKIRDEFKAVDNLVSSTKQVFLKAPQRVAKYRELCPGLALVPKPVIVRWGTWLTAVSFYWEHFEAIKKVVDSLNETDAACIAKSQKSFNQTVWADLAYIHSNFGGLSQAITKLEKQGLTMQEAMEIFAGVRNQMDTALGEKAEIIRQKFNAIVEKNLAIETVAKICQILSGQNVQCDIPPNLIPFYKFAPLTSCDVERSFSIYKSVLSENRMCFTPNNLEKYLICVCNSKNDF